MLSDESSLGKAILFSLEYAFAEIWQSWGIKPDAVMGEGPGKYLAAYYAGVISLSTAVDLLCADSDLATKIIDSQFSNPRIFHMSSATGRAVTVGDLKSPSYWQKNDSSSLQTAMENLSHKGYKVFIEIAFENKLPKAIDIHFAKRDIYLWSCPGIDSRQGMISTLATLYVHGQEIDWNGFYQYDSGYRVSLPTYPFQKKSFWIKEATKESKSAAKTVSFPFKGTLVNTSLDHHVFEFQLSTTTWPDLQDNHGVVHVGFYQEMLADAIQQLFSKSSYQLKGINFSKILIVSQEQQTVQLVFQKETNGELAFQFLSRAPRQEWTLHVEGYLLQQQPASLPRCQKSRIQKRCHKYRSGDEFYDMLRQRGLPLGKSLQWIEEIWYRQGEALAKFRLPNALEEKVDGTLQIPLGIPDACAQLFHCCLPEEEASFMVVKWEHFCWSNSDKIFPLWCHVKLAKRSNPKNMIIGNVRLVSDKNLIVMEIKDCHMKPLKRGI